MVCSLCISAGPAEVRQAEELYRQTKYREALRTIQPALKGDAAAYRVAGRAAFGLREFKQATEYFDQATQLEPGRSENFLWLGRAYGRRAESGMPLTAPHYASKARMNFERAVDLDPKNAEALNDLFAYYLQAPGFLGGGAGKAQALLPRIKAIDPAEEAYALAQIHEDRKDYTAAEQHLKRAVELAPKSVGRVIDVARFLARRGRFDDSFAWLTRAAKMAPGDPRVLFNRAQTHIEAKQDLAAARQLLERYLRSPLTPDLPSRAEAEKLLQQTGGA